MNLRVFISSPGDVADERTFAQQVIEQELPKDPFLRGKVTLDVVRWDDPNAPATMEATVTPQEAVNRALPTPSQCHIVIVILWSRMGTPLPGDYRKPDGTPYDSGTEWEFLDALQGKPAPVVLVYRRNTKVNIDPDAPDADEKMQQRRRVREFFEKTFRNPDGSLKGGFTEYDTPQAFRDRLRLDLRSELQRRLETEPGTTGGPAPRADPPPYGQIYKALRNGLVIPIIGSGMASAGRPAGTVWDAAKPAFLPSTEDLAEYFAAALDYPSTGGRGDLAKVSSYYEAFKTRALLRERLREVLNVNSTAEFPPPQLYTLLAGFATPMLIVTTNYDTQLERAFHAVGRPYDLVVYPTDRKDLANSVLWWPHGATAPKAPAPNQLDVDLASTTVIFKIHGSLAPESEEWDSFVITEEDYVEFLSRVASKTAIPPVLSAHFQDRSLLFIGYSLHDWNLRIFIRSLSRFFARRVAAGDDDEIPSWAIQEQHTEIERKLWEKRGVYPFSVNLDEFVEKVCARSQA
jgi:hypothetical protein